MTVVYIVIALCAGRVVRWALDEGPRKILRSLGQRAAPALFPAAGIIIGYVATVLPLGQSYARELIRAGLVVGFVSPRPFLVGAKALAEAHRSDLATAYLMGSYILLLLAVAAGYLLGRIGHAA
jgi:fluoride ion exporter CrcB/FEX